MHILFFSDFHDSTLGGIQTSIRSQKHALEQAGHLVTVVSPSPLETDYPPSLTTILLPNIRFVLSAGYPFLLPTKSNFSYLEAQVKKIPPVDIVHIQSNLGVGILGYKYAKTYNLPSVQTMHSRDDVLAENNYRFPIATSWLARRVHAHFLPHGTPVTGSTARSAARYAWEIMINQSEAADWVTVPSKHFKQKLIERGLKKDISVISNGLSDEVVAEAKKFTKLPPNETVRIMWCGRVSPEKRPLEMIDAMLHVDEKVRLDMYGSGAYENKVRQRIKKLGLEKRVSFFTKLTQSEILREMAAHDVLVYNSYGFDNQPMILLEATLSQLPVILCDPDLVDCIPSGSALLTRDPSSIAIAEKVARFVAAPDEANRMRDVMRRHMSDMYQSTHTKEMLELYETVIARRI